MDDYLSKPISRKEIEACLHRWRSPSSATITVRHTETLSTSTIKLVSHETKLTIAQTLQHRTRAIPPLTSPHLTSPHLTSPHLTSPHLMVLNHELLEELRKIAGGKELDHIIDLFLKEMQLNWSPSYRRASRGNKPTY
ncbi:hypothetical protein ACN3VN_01945 [Xylella fastidiosa]|uniref:hypothetical protein n=1 Tax=Xylella fastidiosa TaxID=2371 RepID=UPI0012D8C6E9